MTATLTVVGSHPNRSQSSNRAAAGPTNPTPADVRRAREQAGLTLEKAGELVHVKWKIWQRWETEEGSEEHRRMHPATWELFLVKIKARDLLKRGRLAPQAVKDLGLELPE